VKVGDTITWTNRDIVRHTATARSRAFDLDLPPGASASAVMSRAGAVPYYCRYHPAMRGEISVGV
jgi:plastocyanin